MGKECRGFDNDNAVDSWDILKRQEVPVFVDNEVLSNSPETVISGLFVHTLFS